MEHKFVEDKELQFIFKNNMIHYSIFVFILMICCSSFVRGADTSRSKMSKPDTSLVNKLIKLSFYNNSFVPFALYNSFEALEIAEKINYQKGIEKIVNSLQSTVNSQFLTVSSDSWQQQFISSILNNDVNVYKTLYDSLGYYYFNQGDLGRALDCFRTIERISQINTNNSYVRLKRSALNGIAECYRKIALQYYFSNKENEVSITYLNRALKLFENLGNKLRIGSCYNNIGLLSMKSGNNVLALDYLLKSLKITEELNSETGLAYCNLNIGLVYINEKDYDRALYYERKALIKFKELKDRSGIIKCYYNLGIISSYKGNQIKAIEYYDQAIKINESFRDDRNMINILINIGDAYIKVKDYSKALESFNKALTLNSKVKDKINDIYIINNIADTYLKLKKYDDALRFALVSSKSAKELKELGIENEGYRMLKEIYIAKGDYRKALENSDLFKSTGDSLFNSEKSKKLAELQFRYESEKKDRDILLLNKNNEIKTIKISKQKALIFYMSGGFIVLIIFALVYFRLYNQKRKTAYRHKVLETEMKALRSQMNPHFTFNVLNSIQYFISENDMESAELYIEKFSSLIRQILDQSRTTYITLEQEITILKLYLELEEMRFEKKFNYSLNIDSSIDMDKVLIPGMLIQPIVENAIKHGIKHREGNALINISFTSRDSLLVCNVTDNGIGLTESKKINADKSTKSTATSIIKERIDALSSIYNIRLSYKTEDLFNDEGKPEGVSVTIEIPIGIKEEEFSEI
jgi:tetratricopeptide (TPR) repeat protein